MPRSLAHVFLGAGVQFASSSGGTALAPPWKELIPVFLLFFLGVSGQAWAAKEAPSGPAPTTIAELQETISGVLERARIPGAGIALVNHGGTIWCGGVGLAHVAKGRKATAKTLFRVGSITKSFVAVAILQLQERGRLQLSDRVEALAPQVVIANPWEATDPVLLVQLLEHTAGFDEINLAQWSGAAGTGGIQEALPLLASILKCRWRPGTMYSYSNADSVVAGVIIENVASQPFDLYVTEHILRPLGMTNACIRVEHAKDEDMARSYRQDGVSESPSRPSRFRPSGALVASPEEMARFLRMLLLRGTLDGCEILRSESINRMERPETTLAARAGLKCGYGLGIIGMFRNGFFFRGHGGATNAFLSEYGYLPDLGLGYFFSINAIHDPKAMQEIGDLIATFLTRGYQPPAPPEFPPDLARLTSFAGYYEPIAPRNEGARFASRMAGIRRVSPRPDGLEVSSLLGPFWPTSSRLPGILDILVRPLLAPSFDLVPAGPDRFRLASEPVATAIFLQDPDGATVLQTKGGTFRRVPTWFVLLEWVLAVVVIGLMISAGLLSVRWIPCCLRHGPGAVPHAVPRFLAWLPGTILVAVILLWQCGGDETVERFGNPTALSISVWILSWVFVGSSFFGPVFILSSKVLHGSRPVWVHSFLTSLATAALAAYLVYWGQFQRSWVP